MVRKASEITTPVAMAVRSSQPVAKTARVMCEHGIGAVLVVDDRQLTDADTVARP